ncbi:MAG: hypothetical protein ABEJ31_05220 [Haloarculaceae archaeon]
MSEGTGVSDQYRMASPWPMFVALGLAIAEVGIFIGLFSVAVGGQLLFAGSVAGILKESGYVDELWTTLLGFGVFLAVAGAALFASQVTLDASVVLNVIQHPGGYGRVVPRALAIALAGLILLAVGVTGRTLEDSGAQV